MPYKLRVWRRAGGALLLAYGLWGAPAAQAIESLQWNGFALIRPQTSAGAVPLDNDTVSAQIQLGLDWRPAPDFGAHVHLLVRNEGDESRRGRYGIVEAFAEKNFQFSHDRLRIMGGAFFLPTSRENIDSLWETPYTITSSALNTWMGEEFRPVGFDFTWMHRTRTLGSLTGGATVFAGNDTFGALPVDRGWAIHDRWTLLGEHVLSRTNIYTSVSAETDNRVGWSARAKWNNDQGALQYTRIDNRSDARLYGELFNWATQFNIVGADYALGDWTVAGEAGWGKTAIEGRRGRRTSVIRANYLLLSRRFGRMRASLRGDEFKAGNDPRGTALTAAFFFEPYPRLRTGVEGIVAGDEERLAVEVRYRF